MRTTRSSLLARLKDRGDEIAWREFYRLYPPLLYRFARSRGLPHADAEEVRDQCLAVVVKAISGFEYQRARGGFKAWLRTMAENKVRDLLRGRRERAATTEEILAVPGREPTPAEVWEQNWRSEHLLFCVELVRPEVSEPNFAIFRLLLDGLSVPEVCGRLGVSARRVYKAKEVVLRRVRRKLAVLEGEGSPVRA